MLRLIAAMQQSPTSPSQQTAFGYESKLTTFHRDGFTNRATEAAGLHKQANEQATS